MNDEYEKYISSITGTYWTNNNSIKILKDGDEIFSSMLEEIHNAKENIDLLTYVYWKGKIAKDFADALIQKAEEGIKVRVILDAFGARLISKKVIKNFKKSSVELRYFRKLNLKNIFRFNNRTHRKILICDKKIGYTGGVGIAQEWKKPDSSKEWKDIHFKISGPILYTLQSAFAQNWYNKNECIDIHREHINISESPENCVRILGLDSQPTLGLSKYYLLLQALLQVAKNEINITTPYFVLNKNLFSMLKAISKKDVNINILVPGSSTDSNLSRFAGEYFYDDLIAHGIKIYRYSDRMIHSKVIVIDGKICCVGSSNFNQRSIHKDDELSLVINDEETSKILNDRFQENLSQSEIVDKKSRQKNWLLKKVRESVCYFLFAKNV